MSHYTVLVIGDHPEDQLQPYHEFECTGTNDQYVVEVDKTAEVRKQMDHEGKTLTAALDDVGLTERIVRPEARIDLDDQHKYGYAVVADDGALVKAVRRTNPRARWDWHLLGGRWTGFFRLKPGKRGKRGEPGVMTEKGKAGTADQARKGDIDFDAMRAEAGEQARKAYRAVYAALGNLPLPPRWETVRAEYATIETAREAYRDNPSVRKLRDADLLPWSGDPAEMYGCSEEEFVARARHKALGTFAIVKDSQWFERGRMGWWGMVHNEQDEEAWLKQFSDLLDGLPDDTLLSLFDCHI